MKLMKLSEVAEVLGVSRRTIYSYADKGELTLIKLGDKKQSGVRIDEAEVKRFIKKRAI